MGQRVFRKYQHIERFGTSEVDGIEIGECYVFPKIDGTNGSVWLSDGEVRCGSRNRELSIESDNAGFCRWVLGNKEIRDYLLDNPDHRLFGEWLVPHTLKGYREDAWRKFYVFDVGVDDGDTIKYLHYEDYSPLLESYWIDFIPPISIIKNGTRERFIGQLAKNVFLLDDGAGVGEGIVIKRYDFFNRYGRQVWAKIVTSEFKERHVKEMGAPRIKEKSMVEEAIAEQFVTVALCEKVKAKIELKYGVFTSKNIPELLNTVYYDLIREDSWEILKKFKNPVIDYRRLIKFVFSRVKKNIGI